MITFGYIFDRPFSHFDLCEIGISSVRQTGKQWEIFLSYSVYYYAAVKRKQRLLLYINDK